MIFSNWFSQKIGCPAAFSKIVVYRPVFAGTIGFIIPFLIACGSKDGMFNGENKTAVIDQAAAYFATERVKIFNIMQCQ